MTNRNVPPGVDPVAARRARRAHEALDKANAKVKEVSENRRKAFAEALDSGMNQSQLGEVVGLHRARISHIMSGR